jgi:hypothetical protein
MADRKISDLTALTTPASGDYLPIVDISEVAAASKNKRITIEELMRGAPDGTAAAPSIAFESDPNTGIYSPGADQLAISTNGTGRLFVDANGNIGIGEMPNTYKFDLTGNGISTRESGNSSRLVIGTFDAGGFNYIAADKIGTGSYQPLIFQTGGAERIRLTSAGLLGLGTSSPQSSLDIANGTFQSVRTYLSSITDTYHLYRGTPDGSGFEHARVFSGRDTSVHTYGSYLAFYTEGKTSGTTDTSVERLRMDSSGRVGIGTTSPSTYSANLAVFDGAGNGVIAIAQSTSNTTLQSNGQDFYINLKGSGSTIFRRGAGDTESARIDSSGRVGIGTTSPVSLLQVGTGNPTANTAKALFNTNDTTAFGLSISNWTGVAATNGPRIAFDNSTHGVFSIGGGNGTHSFVIRDEQTSSDRFTIDSSGRLLVGTSSDSGGALLQVNDNRIRIATANTPASAGATGTTGEIAWDASYIYVCTATNTWKRTAISTW